MRLISSSVGVIIGALCLWPIFGWQQALIGAAVSLPLTLAISWTWQKLDNIERMLEDIHDADR